MLTLIRLNRENDRFDQHQSTGVGQGNIGPRGRSIGDSMNKREAISKGKLRIN